MYLLYHTFGTALRSDSEGVAFAYESTSSRKTTRFTDHKGGDGERYASLKAFDAGDCERRW